MAQQVKEFSGKLTNLNSIPVIHVVEEKILLETALTSTYLHISTHAN